MSGAPPPEPGARAARGVPTGRARRGVRVLLVGVGLLLLVAVAGYPVLVTPRTDPLPTAADPADAVVALGGAETAGLATELLDRGLVERLVVADPYQGYPPDTVAAACERARTDPAVSCFDPDPSTTRGEAREIRDLGAAEGWEHVVVVAPDHQLERARYIVGRCWAGELSMVDAGVETPLLAWPSRYVYQGAGWARALLTQRGC